MWIKEKKLYEFYWYKVQDNEYRDKKPSNCAALYVSSDINDLSFSSLL